MSERYSKEYFICASKFDFIINCSSQMMSAEFPSDIVFLRVISYSLVFPSVPKYSPIISSVQ